MIFFLFFCFEMKAVTEGRMLEFLEKAAQLSGYRLENVEMLEIKAESIPTLPKNFKNTISFDFHELLKKRPLNDALDFEFTSIDNKDLGKKETAKATGTLLGFRLEKEIMVSFWRINPIYEIEERNIPLYMESVYVVLEYAIDSGDYTYEHLFKLP